MKFIYGKQNWTERARGQENCYLLTNGLGGYSSATMLGSNTRSDHAFFMACTQAPDHRYNMINRLEEELETGDMSVHLSSQEYVDSDKNEEGFRYLSSFSFEDHPKWIFHMNGVEAVKEIAMEHGENLAAVKYVITNRTAGDVVFKVTPHLQFVPKNMCAAPFKEFEIKKDRISSEGQTVYFHTNGAVRYFSQRYTDGLYYAYDECDGRESIGNDYANHRIECTVPGYACRMLEIIYSLSEIKKSADEVIKEADDYRSALADASGMKQDAARMLAKSADQFIVQRASTGGKTIIAGYPFFGDWGRDTMIALSGCCISAGQLEAAKSILRTFAGYCKDGLMPNLFPDGSGEPRYNTVDAALLYIHAVYLYVQKTKDLQFAKEVRPVMEDIIRWYRKGTAYGIRMDEDGLLLAGEAYDQVTWMDVRIGEILPTPRHGKPVEVNVYWYNALCMMDALYGQSDGQAEEGRKETGAANAECDYAYLAQKVKKSFQMKFWNEDKKCLKDVISGTASDNQIRCNQIWAVSMPFALLEREQERLVVDTVFEKLYTPYGLRTLEMSDPQFHGWYGGEQLDRDLAYHQGTVWVFPLGAYYLAYLKTRGYSKEAKEKVKEQLEALESALGEGCIGQLSEIYDGENPSFSKGCFAQAWSVGEILRVYEALQ